MYESPSNPPTPLSHQQAAASSHGEHSSPRKSMADGRPSTAEISKCSPKSRSDVHGFAVPNQSSSGDCAGTPGHRVVEAAPPLSDTQVRRLRSLLGGAE